MRSQRSVPSPARAPKIAVRPGPCAAARPARPTRLGQREPLPAGGPAAPGASASDVSPTPRVMRSSPQGLVARPCPEDRVRSAAGAAGQPCGAARPARPTRQCAARPARAAASRWPCRARRFRKRRLANAPSDAMIALEALRQFRNCVFAWCSQRKKACSVRGKEFRGSCKRADAMAAPKRLADAGTRNLTTET